MMKSVVEDPMLSPNNNNNHVDAFPQHTYATHKLPSFIEMISSQKSRNSTPNPEADFPSDGIKHINSEMHTTVESNGAYTSEDESAHAIDLSKTSGSLVINSGKNSHQNGTEAIESTINDSDQFGNDSQIGQYLAKNPNLTFKGSGDIMNMDIIFENVSIEEDLSISNDTRAESTGSLIEGMEATEDPQTVGDISDPQVENVNFDGVHYQIITLENGNVKEEHGRNDNNQASIENATINIVDDLNEPIGAMQEAIKNVIDTIPVISQNSLGENYVLNSDEVVIMSPCSSFDVAAEVEAGDETNDEIRWPVANSKSEPQRTTSELDNTEIKSIKFPIAVKKESTPPATVLNTDPSANTDRKRKRKVVPLLATNKRTRKNNADKIIEINTEPPAENQNVSIKTETDQSIESSTRSSGSSHNDQIPDEKMLDSSQIDNPSEAESKVEGATPGNNFMDSLVVVESEDPKDPSKTIYEVYIIDPETKEMSDKPLDLPDDVIQKIRMSMSS